MQKCPCLMPLLPRRDAEPPFLFAYLHLVKTRLLQTLFAERFGLPLSIPVHQEEAAYGAALTALVGAGAAANIAEAQRIIRYQPGATAVSNADKTNI